MQKVQPKPANKSKNQKAASAGAEESIILKKAVE
jgi:hypothetical protein